MEVAFGLEPLREALSLVKPARAAGPKVKPAWNSIRLDAPDTDGPATLSATNGEIYLSAAVIGTHVSEPGRLLLPERFLAIVAAAPKGEQVRVRVVDRPKGPAIEIIIFRSKYELEWADPDEFPDAPKFGDPESGRITVKGSDLARLISRTVRATDPESQRYALGGCLFEFDDEQDALRLVATDGRRLHVAVAPATALEPPAWPESPVVPARALKALLAIGERCPEDEVGVTLANAGATFRGPGGSWTLTTRLVEGRFPRYQDVFPAGDPAATVRLDDGDALTQVVQMAGITADKDLGSIVEVEVTEAGILAWSTGRDIGTGEAEFHAAGALDGRPFHASYKGSMLLDAIEAAGAEAGPLTLRYHGLKAAMMIEGPDFKAAVMPCSSDYAGRRVQEPKAEATAAVA